MANIEGKGGFIVGQSGNPRGRPKKDLILAELAKSHVVEAIKTIVEIMQQSKKGNERLHAAELILERAFGRPPLALGDSKNIEALQPVINIRIQEKKVS